MTMIPTVHLAAREERRLERRNRYPHTTDQQLRRGVCLVGGSNSQSSNSLDDVTCGLCLDAVRAGWYTWLSSDENPIWCSALDQVASLAHVQDDLEAARQSVDPMKRKFAIETVFLFAEFRRETLSMPEPPALVEYRAVVEKYRSPKPPHRQPLASIKGKRIRTPTGGI